GVPSSYEETHKVIMRFLVLLGLGLLAAVVSARPQDVEGKYDDVKILVNKENKIEKKDTNKAKSNIYDSYNYFEQQDAYGLKDSYGGAYAEPYGASHYAPTYQSSYVAPVAKKSYGASSYARPSYAAPSYTSSYATPSYAAPSYSSSYAAPMYGSPYSAPTYSSSYPGSTYGSSYTASDY
ncbi:hypothetical protein QYM36_005251, partial [Artemia franciscana]